MDGEKTKQDALSEKGQPSVDGTSPSKPQPRTFTEEEVEEKLATRHSKLDSRISQLIKERDDLKRSGEATFSELQSLQQRTEQLESERFKDNPDEQTRFQAEQKFRREKMAFEQEKAKKAVEWAERQEEIEAAKIVHRDNLIIKLSAKYGIEAALLDKDYLKTEDELTDYAETLATRVLKKEPAKNLILDPGKTSGGGDALANLSPKDRVKEADRRLRTK